MEDPQRVYANYTGVQGGVFDVALDFGYQEGESTERLVRVAMSWEHAAAVVELLKQQIDAYQERVGPLPDLNRIKEDRPEET